MTRICCGFAVLCLLLNACSSSNSESTSPAATGSSGGTTETGETTGQLPPDPPPSGTAPVGAPCSEDGQCAGGACLQNGLLPLGYCTVRECATAGCPAGSACIDFTGGQTVCVAQCTEHEQCTGLGIETCNTDDQCWLGAAKHDDSGVGGACVEDAHCVDPGAFCYPETLSNGTWSGFVHGYCLINDCSPGNCPAGSTCLAVYEGGGTACVANCMTTSDCRWDEGYACEVMDGVGVCFPGCGVASPCPVGYGCDPSAGECVPACTETSCPSGKICGDEGVCVEPPCTETSCAVGLKCAASGICIPDLAGGPGVGPGPDCPNLPERDCIGTAAYCGEIIQYVPSQGPGYDDYPINGEGSTQTRSWARRDQIMLVKWAAAYVECKAATWNGGNGMPLGLGDMSEQNGAIPGTATGSPGHPPGTHVNGYDIDIAYYQNQPPNNYLRAICDHVENGQDQYHCTSAPWRMDVWRTALFIGALFHSPRTRVIGVDGRAGELLVEALAALCGNDWLPEKNCNMVKNYSLAWELTDTGMGWFRFHHHHMHLSLNSLAGGKPGGSNSMCLVEDCTPAEHDIHHHAH